MFARDIDLLVIDPALFEEAAWNGQRLVSGSGSLSGTTLTMSGADFAAAGVEAGCVLLMAGVPLEVVERLSATTLRISIIRWGRSGPPIPPVGLSTGPCEVWTLRPQIELAHRQVLRTLGLSGQEAQVLNGSEVATFEALLALWIVYAAAGAAAPLDSPLHKKAQMFRVRAAEERSRLSALIDTDSDGRPDATRRPSVIPLQRL